MPELPEVETIRRDLTKVIVGKKIIGLEVISKSPIKGSARDFLKAQKNKTIKNIGRIGKLMMWELSSGNFLLVHLKMTGQLIYRHGHQIIEGGHNLPVFKENDLPTKYTWVVWKFNDGSQLYFNDMRKFGYLKIVGRAEKEKIESDYGIEPLAKNFTLVNFAKIFSGRKTSVKAILLNQQLIAGIGNIYADEICFEAGLLPHAPAGKLGAKEIKKLFAAAKVILQKAIKHKGTTFRDYINPHGRKGNFSDFLRVYQRDGEKCLRCHRGIITKKKIGGRGSHYCPVCQKMIN